MKQTLACIRITLFFCFAAIGLISTAVGVIYAVKKTTREINHYKDVERFDQIKSILRTRSWVWREASYECNGGNTICSYQRSNCGSGSEGNCSFYRFS